MARKRITVGVPITTEHGGGDINTTERRAIADAVSIRIVRGPRGVLMRCIREQTGLFITLKDFLMMNYDGGANVDETVPLLRSLTRGFKFYW